jgi:ubiquitin-like protein Pup
MALEKKNRTASRTEQDTVEDTATEQDTQLSDDTDALLDEIDSVLEENAVEFVRSYVQKGGQ